MPHHRNILHPLLVEINLYPALNKEVDQIFVQVSAFPLMPKMVVHAGSHVKRIFLGYHLSSGMQCTTEQRDYSNSSEKKSAFSL